MTEVDYWIAGPMIEQFNLALIFIIIVAVCIHELIKDFKKSRWMRDPFWTDYL